MAKCDVSELSIDRIHEGLPAFERHLGQHGFGLYCVDYTQALSGVLDRPALVEHLVKQGFRKQGEHGAICPHSWTTQISSGKTCAPGSKIAVSRWGVWGPSQTRQTKIYNKVVSNFEAGEIREPVGGHLADYADCLNGQLRATFQHPDVQARGFTRIEVSVYGPPVEELGQETAEDVLWTALGKVSPEGEGLFVVQPPQRQWQNLAAALDCCMVLADRPNGTIFAAWYGHSKTKRTAGARVAPTPAVVQDDANWERAVQWAMADFGFRRCPIFRVDVLEANQEGVQIGPLCCYMKPTAAPTILSTAKKPAAAPKRTARGGNAAQNENCTMGVETEENQRVREGTASVPAGGGPRNRG